MRISQVDTRLDWQLLASNVRNTLSAIALLFAFLVLVAGAPQSAMADGSLEVEAGGTFRNAGFINHTSASGRQAAASTSSSSGSVASSSSSEAVAKKRSRGSTRVASLGNAVRESAPKPQGSLTGGGNVNWVASSSCLASNLRSVINHVAQNYGSVRVSSTCRSHAHNRRVGGAPKSWHLTGDAADFRVFGNVSGAYAYLRSAVGGLKHYGGGLFHVDNGDRRSF